MTKIRDMKVFEHLAIVTIDGFDGEPRWDGDADHLGSANYLCEAYGMASGPGDEDATGILWADYDDSGWRFSVLIDEDEVAALKETAEEAGYAVGSIEAVTEPRNFGDGNGTVEILKSRFGWVVVEN